MVVIAAADVFASLVAMIVAAVVAAVSLLACAKRPNYSSVWSMLLFDYCFARYLS